MGGMTGLWEFGTLKTFSAEPVAEVQTQCCLGQLQSENSAMEEFCRSAKSQRCRAMRRIQGKVVQNAWKVVVGGITLSDSD